MGSSARGERRRKGLNSRGHAGPTDVSRGFANPIDCSCRLASHANCEIGGGVRRGMNNPAGADNGRRRKGLNSRGHAGPTDISCGFANPTNCSLRLASHENCGS